MRFTNRTMHKPHAQRDTRPTIRRELVVDVPAHTAWNHFAKVEEWITWSSDLDRVEMTPKGAITADSQGILVTRSGVRATVKVVAYEPYVRWAWWARILWARFYINYDFEPTDDNRTLIRWTVHVSGFAGQVFAVVFGRHMNKAIPNLIHEMRSLAGRVPMIERAERQTEPDKAEASFDKSFMTPMQMSLTSLENAPTERFSIPERIIKTEAITAYGSTSYDTVLLVRA
jgi:hypothetical protein